MHQGQNTFLPLGPESTGGCTWHGLGEVGEDGTGERDKEEEGRWQQKAHESGQGLEVTFTYIQSTGDQNSITFSPNGPYPRRATFISLKWINPALHTTLLSIEPNLQREETESPTHTSAPRHCTGQAKDQKQSFPALET